MSDVPKKSKELLQMMLEYESLENITVQRNASAGLFALLLGAQMLSGSGSGHKDSRYCNGDCANCPPHYGYRYGRWYYGHGHQGGCERGGNGGASGRTYRD